MSVHNKCVLLQRDKFPFDLLKGLISSPFTPVIQWIPTGSTSDCYCMIITGNSDLSCIFPSQEPTNESSSCCSLDARPAKATHRPRPQAGSSQPHPWAGSGHRSWCRAAQLFRIWNCTRFLIEYSFPHCDDCRKREVSNSKGLPLPVFQQLLGPLLLKVLPKFNFKLLQNTTPPRSFNMCLIPYQWKTVLFLCC